MAAEEEGGGDWREWREGRCVCVWRACVEGVDGEE